PYRVPPHLHSFPTLRSSDLPPLVGVAASQPDRVPPQSGAALPAEHDRDRRALPLRGRRAPPQTEVVLGLDSRTHATEARPRGSQDRKSTRLNSSHVSISYAV